MCRLNVFTYSVQFVDPKLVDLPNDRTDTYLQCLKQEINSQLQLVVAIFPTSRDDRYAAFKKYCCIERPIPSQVSHTFHSVQPHSCPVTHQCHLYLLLQVINARTISQQQKLRSVTQKIALQINCKLGGELWAVEIPAVSSIHCWPSAQLSPSMFAIEKPHGDWSGCIP